MTNKDVVQATLIARPNMKVKEQTHKYIEYWNTLRLTESCNTFQRILYISGDVKFLRSECMRNPKVELQPIGEHRLPTLTLEYGLVE